MQNYLNPANWLIDWEGMAQAGLAAGVAVLLALLIHRIAFGIAHKIATLSDSQVDDVVVERLRSPVKWSLVAIALTLAAQVDPLLASLWEPIARFVDRKSVV